MNYNLSISAKWRVEFFASKKIIVNEFIRYVLVEETAFFIDITTLYFFTTKVFLSLGYMEIYISVALGFIAELIFNYIFSLTFVFKIANEQKKGRNMFSFFLFVSRHEHVIIGEIQQWERIVPTIRLRQGCPSR